MTCFLGEGKILTRIQAKGNPPPTSIKWFNRSTVWRFHKESLDLNVQKKEVNQGYPQYVFHTLITELNNDYFCKYSEIESEYVQKPSFPTNETNHEEEDVVLPWNTIPVHTWLCIIYRGILEWLLFCFMSVCKIFVLCILSTALKIY